MKFSLFINAIGILFLILLASPTNYASVILFPELKEEELEEVCSAIKKFYGKS